LKNVAIDAAQAQALFSQLESIFARFQSRQAGAVPRHYSNGCGEVETVTVITYWQVEIL
jgi:hypothetical protein